MTMPLKSHVQVQSGAILDATGTGVINATWLQGVVVNGVAPTLGQVLTATSPTSADWQNSSGGFTDPMTTTQA
jgi:hypothetical protein